MRSWRFAIILAALLLPALLWAGQISFDYSTVPRTIRACQLLVPAGRTNPQSHVLPVLARSPLKPPGWTFVNPLAPTNVTAAVWNRWLDPNHNADPSDPAVWRSGPNYWAGRGLAAGSPLLAAVPPEWPQYWEVPLDDATAEQLVQFDLLYVANAADLDITSPVQRAALRRAVENGAVLWVDNAGGDVVNFPLPRNAAAAPFGFGALGGNLTNRVAPFPAHALLSAPYRLSSAEVARLGDYPDGPAGPFNAYQVLDPGGNDVPLDVVVATVTNSGSGAGIAAARYGDGALVVTAEAVGADIEEWYAGFAEPDDYQRPDLKLAYNIANYSHAAGIAAGGPSSRSVEFAPVRPPLELQWQFPPPWGDPTLPSLPGPFVGSPAVSDGRIYALSTFGTANRTPALWCIVPQPGTPNGYQLAWRTLLGGLTPRASCPVVAYTRTGGGQRVPAVLAVAVNPAGAATGTLLAVDLTSPSGAVARSRTLNAYSGTARVLDLSTPVVYKNWVFVLASEWDTNLPGGGIQGTYGRVHCLDLETLGQTAYWVYPDPARGEHQKLLPAFHDPNWIIDPNRSEIPPEGDVRPAVVTSLRTPLGTPVEAALVFSCAARVNWAAPNVNTVASPSQYALVPTPCDGSGAPLLNAQYYLTRLNHNGVTSVTSPATRDDGTPTPPTVVVNTAPYTYGGEDYAEFNNVGGPGGVLEHLATLSGAAPYNNPLTLRSGCRVAITYQVGATTYPGEVHYLPGPVAWARTRSASHVTEHSGTLAATGSGVSVMETETGRLLFAWTPTLDSPLAVTTTNESAAAHDADTVMAVSNVRTGASPAEWTGMVHGVRTAADLTLHLGRALPDSVRIADGSAVTVVVLQTGAPVPSGLMDVDYSERLVRFRSSAAALVAGKAVLVNWTDSTGAAHTNEVHVLPKLARFEYLGGWVRLQRYPVILGSISITLTDGTPVNWPANFHEPTVNFNLDGSGAVPVLPNGWIRLYDPATGTGATVTDALGVAHSVVGREIVISYRGWSEPDGAVVNVGPGGAYPAEHQQVPVFLGSNRSGAGVSGQTVTVGSLGAVDPSGNFLAPPGGESPFDTLLSLVWDPIKRFVTGRLARPAYSDPAAPLVPGVLGTPTSAGGRLYVGTAGLSAPLTVGEPGWVGCLGPRRTLICDGNRLVETTGSERTWVLTGSKAYTYGRSAPEPKRTVPFSRPAKCAALSDGSLLVVDTGNNRVIVVDRQGNQTWPLDEYGFDYYSSPARTDPAVPGGVAGNYNLLQLSQPADAHRYVDAAGAAHTVIADTGHNRVVDVITTTLPGGGTQHRVVEVTPSHVRPPWDPTRQLKLRYVRAQPIFDFNNNNVIGYLCAATNVDRVVVVEAGTRYVDPNPSTIPPGGTRPWADWLPLYDPTSGPRFPNLRHVEYFRYGDRAYVAVVAGGIGNSNEDGVWLWEINTITGPVSGPGPFGSTWSYTATDYAGAGVFSRVVTPAGATYVKRFYPVCAKLLYPGPAYGGNVLITNYTGVIEHLARENVGSVGSGLNGEVFEVDINRNLLEGRTIPDPFEADWNDPLNQPAYAERH